VRYCSATYEKKISTCCFPFVNVGINLTELSKVLQEGCFNFAQMKASVELCINKLSDAAAKSEH